MDNKNDQPLFSPGKKYAAGVCRLTNNTAVSGTKKITIKKLYNETI
jgi:hypothetical protein